MFLILLLLFAIEILIASIPLPGIHCKAQETFIVRDPRIRHRGLTNAINQTDPNNAQLTLNATTLIQQLPSLAYRDNYNENIYQPHYSLPQRNTPPEVAKYRNLGNYYQDIQLIASQPISSLPVPADKKDHKRHLEYNTPFRFDNHVLHLNKKATQDIRPRRYTNVNSVGAPTQNELNDLKEANDSKTLQSQGVMSEHVKREGNPTTIEQTKSFHDIFMRYNGPHQMSFGHVELNPKKRFQKRFESLNNNNGNRHRGEIVWTDAQGGYGEHHWDLMQGKLR